jgi:hypothetical protein
VSETADGGAPDSHEGDGVLRASWVGTALMAAVGAFAVLVEGPFIAAYVFLSLAAFVLGAVAFALGFLRAVGRSRTALIGMGGLFFVAGCGPPRVRRSLVGSFAAQCAVSVAVAAVGFAGIDDTSLNPLAFGTLAPLYGLGLTGWWTARFGVFPPRPADGDTRGGQASPAPDRR